jgi:hypothetical protein
MERAIQLINGSIEDKIKIVEWVKLDFSYGN